MRVEAAPLVAGNGQGPIVAALSGLTPRAPAWIIPALADLVESLARETLPREAAPEMATRTIETAAELVSSAYLDETKWRSPPEDGWPRGAGRRRRLGAIAEELANSAALGIEDFAALPSKMRKRALQLARMAVVMLARQDPQVGSRLLAPERARIVLERAASAARSAHDMGQKP